MAEQVRLRGGQVKWTDEHDDMLKRLWKQGLSCSQIAKKMHEEGAPDRSRNAIIGRVHRLRLVARGDTPRQNRTYQQRRAAALRAPKEKRVLKHAAVTVFTDPAKRTAPWKEPRRNDIARVAFDELTALHCRWPVGDPKQCGFGFCGAVVSGATYCEEHHRRAFPAMERAA
jgi:GcrA cell cycle regulator